MSDWWIKRSDDYNCSQHGRDDQTASQEKNQNAKVMVGGAVLNQDYSDMIGADFYGKDAMQSVYYAQQLFGGEK